MIAGGCITLTRDQAGQVYAVLAVVEDWLLGCTDWILDDLTAFVRPGGQARQVVDDLGDAGCILGRLLRQQGKQ